MENADFPSSPIWLDEEVWISKLLTWFVVRTEKPRTKAITRKINPRTVPELFNFSNDTDYLWSLLQALSNQYDVFTIRIEKTRGVDSEEYENATLILNLRSVDMLRNWLQRPAEDPITKQWESAIAPHASAFSDHGEALINNPPTQAGWSAEEIVRSLALIPQYLNDQHTLREISARCFLGDSKFLDNRLELIFKLFGADANKIQPRPLLLTAYAPKGFSRLIIVENQDTFLWLSTMCIPEYALLYSGGFRASAQRLNSSQTQFSFLPGSDSDYFHQVWKRSIVEKAFWGDLDFSGMAILKALRSSLPDLHSWQPGYAPMLSHIKSGKGHTAEQSGKSGQLDPGTTGCEYADEILLPHLRQKKLFTDQEGFHGLVEL